ncbi:hypothetical protein QQM39_19000 [Streptomyces sp. DT2A-34]|nr:hypothetical protein [Streptomyces sp. DT2A-34]MDO0912854.1 hypothetical protein [Streptomyces sp. DT2A-34]
MFNRKRKKEREGSKKGWLVVVGAGVGGIVRAVTAWVLSQITDSA